MTTEEIKNSNAEQILIWLEKRKDIRKKERRLLLRQLNRLQKQKES